VKKVEALTDVATWSSGAQVMVSFHESIKPVDTCHSHFPVPREFKVIFTASIG
jgi:hypothetical protein